MPGGSECRSCVTVIVVRPGRAAQRLGERVQEHQPAGQVEAGGRLVEHEQRRVGDECAGEQDAGALALRAGDERAVGEARPRRRARAPRARGARRPPRRAGSCPPSRSPRRRRRAGRGRSAARARGRRGRSRGAAAPAGSGRPGGRGCARRRCSAASAPRSRAAASTCPRRSGRARPSARRSRPSSRPRGGCPCGRATSTARRSPVPGRRLPRRRSLPPVDTWSAPERRAIMDGRVTRGVEVSWSDSKEPLWQGVPERVRAEPAPAEAGDEPAAPAALAARARRRGRRARWPAGPRGPRTRCARTSSGRSRGRSSRRRSRCRRGSSTRSLAARTRTLNDRVDQLNVLGTKLADAQAALTRSEGDVSSLEVRQRQLADEKAAARGPGATARERRAHLPDLQGRPRRRCSTTSPATPTHPPATAPPRPHARPPTHQLQAYLHAF